MHSHVALFVGRMACFIAYNDIVVTLTCFSTSTRLAAPRLCCRCICSCHRAHQNIHTHTAMCGSQPRAPSHLEFHSSRTLKAITHSPAPPSACFNNNRQPPRLTTTKGGVIALTSAANITPRERRKVICDYTRQKPSLY